MSAYKWSWMAMSCGLKGFQAVIHPGEYMHEIYLGRDVRVFHTTLIVRYREPEPTNSWFGYHVYQWLRSVHFVHKANGKINFNHIYL
jgi:hypothetical protein